MLRLETEALLYKHLKPVQFFSQIHRELILLQKSLKVTERISFNF